MERNRLDRLRQHADGAVAVSGRHKISPCLTIVTPMSDAHGVMLVQVIQRRSKVRFLPGELRRTSSFSAFIADHHKPNNERTRIIARSRVKGDDGDFASIVEYPKIFSLEVPNREVVLRILTDDIDENQRGFNADSSLCGTRLNRLLRKTA